MTAPLSLQEACQLGKITSLNVSRLQYSSCMSIWVFGLLQQHYIRHTYCKAACHR